MTIETAIVCEQLIACIGSTTRGAEPSGASGVFARRDGGREHSTQYYSDGYRLSRDTGQGGDRDVHWTNQGVAKGSSSRHTPPSDAR